MQNHNQIMVGDELVQLDEHSWNNISPQLNHSVKINFDTYANPPNDLQMQRAQSCLNPPKEVQLCRLKSDNQLQNPLKHEEMQVLLKLYNMGFSPFHITYLTKKHNMSLTIPNFMNIIIDLIAMDERYQDVINAGHSKSQSKSSYQLNINEDDDWVDIVVDQQEEVVKQISEIKINVPIQAASLDNPCLICLVSEADSKYLQCNHQFCSDCYQSYISDAIKRGCIEIGCPQEGCVMRFTEEQLKEHIATNLFMQFQRFKQYKMVDENPNLKWCPKPGCELYVTRTSNDVAECICGQLVCFKCGNVAHEGLECDDAIQRDFQGALKQFKIQHCPQCKSHIQKISGCNHMTCYKCKYQFCWICLQKYHNYHYRYWSMAGCAIWSSGRYKQLNSTYDPDTLRTIFLFPRILIFLLRAPLIFLKLLAKASFKAIKIPCRWGKKNVKKIKINNKCLKCLIKFLFFCLVLVFSLAVFPIILLFYTVPMQIKMLTIKGCAF